MLRDYNGITKISWHPFWDKKRKIPERGGAASQSLRLHCVVGCGAVDKVMTNVSIIYSTCEPKPLNNDLGWYTCSMQKLMLWWKKNDLLSI